MNLKKSYYTFFVITIIFVLSGCTRNNGDIGDYFGEWRLDKLTADGVEMPIYDSGNEVVLYTWAFHGKIIRINTVYVHHHVENSFGSWLEDGDILELEFSYHDDIEDNMGMYTPPVALHLNSGGITRLHIDKMKDRYMILSQISNGIEYTYHLKRPY